MRLIYQPEESSTGTAVVRLHNLTVPELADYFFDRHECDGLILRVKTDRGWERADFEMGVDCDLGRPAEIPVGHFRHYAVPLDGDQVGPVRLDWQIGRPGDWGPAVRSRAFEGNWSLERLAAFRLLGHHWGPDSSDVRGRLSDEWREIAEDRRFWPLMEEGERLRGLMLAPFEAGRVHGAPWRGLAPAWEGVLVDQLHPLHDAVVAHVTQ